MKIRRCLIIISLFVISILTACTEKVGPYGVKINEDLTTTNIIDDNYRNYYEIYVGGFYDSNKDKTGDLKGVIQKLDYIKNLGFNGIWLMPINLSGSYHKYDVMDYYQIDSSYGTMADLEKLIEECHKRDIKLILDLVLNHSSSNHAWFASARNAYEKYLAGMALTEEEEKFKDFYVFYPSKGDIPATKTCYQVSGKTYYYEANFSSNMPEFNCDSPYVQEEFQKIINFYLDKGVDGFRLDAVKYYYVDSQTKNIEFLSKINEWIKNANPNAYVVAECWDSATTITEYYRSGIDSFFNFSASIDNSSSPIINSINLEGKMLNKYYAGLVANLEMANGHIPAPFLDNHDTPRFTTSGENLRNTKFQYALLQMMNGSTFTYYGDEVGMVGSNAGTLPDENVRLPMRWGEDNKVGDCKMLAGITTSNYPHGKVKEQMTSEDSLYNFYKKVLLIRNQNPDIARGEISLVEMVREDDGDKKLIIKKTYNDSTIGIIFNFSPTRDLSVDYKSLGFNEVIGQIVVDNLDKYIGIKDGALYMPPYSIAVVK